MDLQLIYFAVGVVASVVCAIIVLFYFYAKVAVSKQINTNVDSKEVTPNE